MCSDSPIIELKKRDLISDRRPWLQRPVPANRIGAKRVDIGVAKVGHWCYLGIISSTGCAIHRLERSGIGICHPLINRGTKLHA